MTVIEGLNYCNTMGGKSEVKKGMARVEAEIPLSMELYLNFFFLNRKMQQTFHQREHTNEEWVHKKKPSVIGHDRVWIETTVPHRPSESLGLEGSRDGRGKQLATKQVEPHPPVEAVPGSVWLLEVPILVQGGQPLNPHVSDSRMQIRDDCILSRLRLPARSAWTFLRTGTVA